MARPIRFCPGGTIFHVLNRANSRNQIFSKRFHYHHFIKIVQEALSIYTVKIYSYCIMPNHWHLLLEPKEDGELSRFLGWITNTHTRRYRLIENSEGQGPLYQGRFKSFPVKGDNHFLTVKRTIERNPVQASLVKSADAWPASSIGQDYFDCSKLPISEGHVPTPKNWIEIVNEPLTTKENEEVACSIRKGKPFGDLA